MAILEANTMNGWKLIVKNKKQRQKHIVLEPEFLHY